MTGARLADEKWLGLGVDIGARALGCTPNVCDRERACLGVSLRPAASR